MNITINGDIYITNYGQTLDEIIGDKEDLDIPFDDFDEDIEQEEFNESLDELLDVYSEALSESCICPECIREALVDFLNSFVEL